MKEKIPEEVMQERRIERAKHVLFFLRDSGLGLKISRSLSLSATHNLLMGYFQNSHWRAAWYCFGQALLDSLNKAEMNCRLFYYYKVLRLTEEQIEERWIGQ